MLERALQENLTRWTESVEHPVLSSELNTGVNCWEALEAVGVKS